MSHSSSHLGGGAGGGGGLGAAGLDAEDGGAAGSLGGRHGLGDLDAGEGGGSSDHFFVCCCAWTSNESPRAPAGQNVDFFSGEVQSDPAMFAGDTATDA